MASNWPDPGFMRRALELAAMGARSASPNPVVGAVVVRDGHVVSEGFHVMPGSAHAEVIALSRAGERSRGADLYVTLEPCSHSGEGKRTAPCAPLVVASGVRRVALATLDPNPRVSGRGVGMLKEAGIDVSVGVCAEEAAYLNRGFVSAMVRSRPWVTAKWAMSLDGKSAAVGGDSKWITSDVSRLEGHRERAESDAIMVGIGTVLADDPELSVRLDEGLSGEGRQPVRVVIDPGLRIPLASRVLVKCGGGRVLVVTRPGHERGKVSALRDTGAEVVLAGDGESRVFDMGAVLGELQARGIQRVLAEGGSGLLGSLFDGGLVDEVLAFVAPGVVVGGVGAVSPVGGAGIVSMAHGHRVIRSEVRINASGEVVVRSLLTNPGSMLPSPF